ncbi:uncharacterized protein LOC110852538 isoform X2 [Folsomia candida]|uniref:uncharacterized protein LOC110852538 isoform X2 n=1 Tax=Folsomia candida TaxID=158441 RepID=UPI000B9055F5|nr:uncharacterized protein LOC110852538 isoform X2 [Folsomia candida]
MTWTRAFPEILLVVMLIVVSSSPHGCLSAAVIPSETRLTAHSFLQPTADNISPNSVRTPRRMMGQNNENNHVSR